MSTDEKIKAILDRCKKATKGPWEIKAYRDICDEWDSYIEPIKWWQPITDKHWHAPIHSELQDTYSQVQ